MAKKIFIILISILFIIIIVEIIYLFFFKESSITAAKNLNSVQISPTLSISPTAVPPYRAFNPELLDKFKYINKSDKVEGLLTNTVTGVIKKIDLNGKDTSFDYLIKLTVQDSQGLYPENTFYVPHALVEHTTIKRGDEIIEPNELNIGDVVEVQMIWNLTRNDIITVESIKININ